MPEEESQMPETIGVNGAVEVSVDEEWRSYDEFADGIDTFRLPPADLSGRDLLIRTATGSLRLSFEDASTVAWHAVGLLAGAEGPDEEASGRDAYDAVAVRESVLFVNLPFASRQGEALTLVVSTASGRAIVVRSAVGEDSGEDVPRVSQRFDAGVLDGVPLSGEEPGESRELIGKRNVYRYSPSHLYEHVYLSSQRYAWQCLEGVQRGHGDVDLSTVWKLEEGLVLFCFREFKIAVASVWLHDLGYALRTTGIFLGLDQDGEVLHSRAGGHIYPLGSVAYPDAQPV